MNTLKAHNKASPNGVKERLRLFCSVVISRNDHNSLSLIIQLTPSAFPLKTCNLENAMYVQTTNHFSFPFC